MLEDLKAKMKTAYVEKLKGEFIFCKMIEEQHEKIIYKHDEIVVMPPLSSDALKEGHLLVIPRKHVKDMFEMTEENVETYFSEVKSLVDNLKEKSRYTGVNLLTANGKSAQQSIRHMHTHIVLRESGDGFEIWPHTKYKGKSFEEVNKELSNLLNS